MRQLRVYALLASMALLLCSCKEFVVLFNTLDETQANPIMAVLMENGIQCQKQPGEEGVWKLLVDQQDFSKAVMLCEERGLPQEIYHGVGEAFKKTGMVSSPTEERIRFMDALSQDLARTISEIDGVISARVHVVLPNNDPFAKNVLPSSAAVAIRHRSDCTLEDTIPQIKNLVMNSIEGVEYDKITVTLFKVMVTPRAEQGAPKEPYMGNEMMQIVITVNAALAVILIGLIVMVLMKRKTSGASKAEPKK